MAFYHQLTYPSSPTTTLEGERCGACGEGLPTRVVHHIVTEESPDEVRAAAFSGSLNSARCEICGYLGLFQASAWIALPDRHRQIFIIPDGVLIPLVAELREQLWGIARAQNVLTAAYATLPRQRASWASELPSLLSVPDRVVPYHEIAEENYVARLAVLPENRPQQFIKDYVGLITRQLEEVQAWGAPSDSNVQVVSFTFLSAFERTAEAMEQLRGELDLQLRSNHCDELKQALSRLREQLAAREKSEESDAHPLPALPPNVRDMLSVAAVWASERESSARSGNHSGLSDVDRDLWVDLVDSLTRLGHLELSLDLSEYYLHRIASRQTHSQDLEIVLAFGSLVEMTGEWRYHRSWDYLKFAASCLPAPGAPASPGAAERAAQARVFMAQFHRREGNYKAAVEEYLDAAHFLLIVPGRESTAAEQARVAITLAEDLGFGIAAERGRELLLSMGLADGGAPLPVARPVVPDSHPDEVNRPHVVVNFLPPGKEWDAICDGYSVPYGSIVAKKIPRNYDARHSTALYESLEFDTEFYAPYSQKLVEEMDLKASFHAVSVTLRLWRRNGDALALSDEAVRSHDLIDWVELATNEEERLARMRLVRPTLWSWAGKRRRARWLAMEYIQRKSVAEEDALSITERAGFGIGFAALCRRQKDLNQAGREALAQEGSGLLGKIFDGKPGRIDHQLAPATACEARSAYGTCLEVMGEFGRAAEMYCSNVRIALRSRSADFDHSVRMQIQALAGADLGRYFRVLLRQHDWELPPDLCRQLLLLGERTRSRSMTEDYLTTKGSDGPHGRLDSLEALSERADLALLDRTYTQLTLVTSHDQFEGGWVSLGAGDNLVPRLRRLEWETPLNVYETLDRVYATHASLDEISEADKSDIAGVFSRATRWLSQVLVRNDKTHDDDFRLTEAVVGPQSYLVNFPWSFVGVLERPHHPAVVATFSYAGFTMANEQEAQRQRQWQWQRQRQRRLALFLAPQPDVGESVENLPETIGLGARDVEVEAFAGMEVGAPRLLRYLGLADCLVYVGHGRHARDKGTTGLVCAGLRILTAAEIQNAATEWRGGPRVALILACWGGTGSVASSIESWEATGLPYSLKAAGIDFIVTSLWPISPRMAAAFVIHFVRGWADGLRVSACVAGAYRALISEFGETLVMLEASGIQLFA